MAASPGAGAPGLVRVSLQGFFQQTKRCYRQHSRPGRFLRQVLSEWVCESDEVCTFPSAGCDWWRCPATRPETPTRRNNRDTYCWWLHIRQFVFPLSFHKELLLPAVPRLAFFSPHLPSELKFIISLDYCHLFCCDLHQGVQNNYQAHFLLV